MMKKQRLLVLLLTLAAALWAFAGCQKAPGVVNPTEETTEIQSVTEATTEATEPQTEAVNENVVIYESKLEAYMKDLPAVAKGTVSDDTTQKKLVDQMVALYDQKAKSTEIRALYIYGIEKLGPEQADHFTAYAVAGLRRNSFEDYTAIEKFSNDQTFMERFFKEGESVDFKFIQFNLKTEAIKDAEIKTLVLAAKEKGYFIASSEGMLYYLVDFTEFAKYRAYNTEAMADLLVTLAIDDLEPMTSDAAIIIDNDTLAARTYGIEKMLKDYKGSLYERYLVVRLKDHLQILFFGTNNSPIFDYENNKITADGRKLFESVASVEGTVMADIASEFLDLLETTDGILTDQMLELSRGLVNMADERYEATEQDMTNFGLWMSGQSIVD